MKRFLIVVLFVTLTAAVTLWAAESLSGRDIADSGSDVVLSGTLVEEKGEWYLESGDETYALHLGNYLILYPQGLNLTAGHEASVRGFLVDGEVAAISVTSNGQTYNFRQADGAPLWAGRGNRRNAVDADSVGARVR